jgi:hypothetical protein
LRIADAFYAFSFGFAHHDASIGAVFATCQGVDDSIATIAPS